MSEKHFPKITNLKSFIKFIYPSILSMIFLSFYTSVDGYFVSKYVGANALASINIIIPLTCLFFGISIMLSTGGGAMISHRLGEGDKVGADNLFASLSVTLGTTILILTSVCYIFLDEILLISGATTALMPFARSYGFWTVVMIPTMMSKLFLEHIVRVDGKPMLSMVMSISGLLLNLIFDYVFIAILNLGITGAGLGTALSMYISAAIGLFHFISKRSTLKFYLKKFELLSIIKSIYNGSSEMLTELSTGVTTLLFNIKLISIAGEVGVAAMSIITYLYYFFVALYFGISVATQPIIAFNLGAENYSYIKKILKYSLQTILFGSIFMFLFSFIMSDNLILFFSDDDRVFQIAGRGLKLFSITFIFAGFNIFTSGYFTAIKSGGRSAIISTCRSLLFVVLYLYLLPLFWNISGVWLTNPMAEISTFIIALLLFTSSVQRLKRKK